MKHRLALPFAALTHLLFGAAFVAHLALVFHVVDAPMIDLNSSNKAAIAANVGLIILFGLQHSMMARPRFKQRINPAYERAIFVLTSTVVFTAVTVFWQPLPGALWNIEHPILRALVHAVQLSGIGLVLLSIFLMDYFEFFGLKQAFQSMRRRPIRLIRFHLPLLYRLIRHPLMLGLLLMYWATPHMTTWHLLMTAGMSVYIIIGIHFEERDLVDRFGEDYVQYRQQTPALIPNFRAVKPGTSTADDRLQSIGGD